MPARACAAARVRSGGNASFEPRLEQGEDGVQSLGPADLSGGEEGGLADLGRGGRGQLPGEHRDRRLVADLTEGAHRLDGEAGIRGEADEGFGILGSLDLAKDPDRDLGALGIRVLLRLDNVDAGRRENGAVVRLEVRGKGVALGDGREKGVRAAVKSVSLFCPSLR